MRSSLRSTLFILALAAAGANVAAATDSGPSPDAADNLNDNNGAAAANGDNELNLSPFLPGIQLNLPVQHKPAANADAAPSYNDFDPAAAPTAATPATPGTPHASPTTTALAQLAGDPFWAIDDLKKRQNGGGTRCPTSYSACSALGAPGLCCRRNTNCAVDQAGHVACCPSGAACTGTIGGAVGGGSTVSGASTSTSLSFVLPSTTTTVGFNNPTSTGSTGGGFIVVASTTVASPNRAGGGRRGMIPLAGWLF